jgi:hypothetical protein
MTTPPPADSVVWATLAPNPELATQYAKTSVFITRLARVSCPEDEALLQGTLEKWGIDLQATLKEAPNLFQKAAQLLADPRGIIPLLGTPDHTLIVHSVRFFTDQGSDMQSCRGSADGETPGSDDEAEAPDAEDAPNDAGAARAIPTAKSQEAVGTAGSQAPAGSPASQDVTVLTPSMGKSASELAKAANARAKAAKATKTAGDAPKSGAGKNSKTGGVPIASGVSPAAADSDDEDDTNSTDKGAPGAATTTTVTATGRSKAADTGNVVAAAQTKITVKKPPLAQTYANVLMSSPQPALRGATSTASAAPAAITAQPEPNRYTSQMATPAVFSGKTLQLPGLVAKCAQMDYDRLPLASSMTIAEGVVVSAQNVDLVLCDDVPVDGPNAYFGTATGRVREYLEHASFVFGLKDGHNKMYVIIRGLTAEKQTSPLSERFRIIQCLDGLSVASLAPNAERSFISGPKKHLEHLNVINCNRAAPHKSQKAHPDTIQRVLGTPAADTAQHCLVAPVHLLGAESLTAHRARVRTSKDVSDRQRFELALQLQGAASCAGTYMAGKDIVIILKEAFTDEAVSQIKAMRGVSGVWCEVSPRRIQARINKNVATLDEVTTLKAPESGDVGVGFLEILIGPDADGEVWSRLAAEIGARVVGENNFLLCQVHMPFTALRPLLHKATKVSINGQEFVITISDNRRG